MWVSAFAVCCFPPLLKLSTEQWINKLTFYRVVGNDCCLSLKPNVSFSTQSPLVAGLLSATGSASLPGAHSWGAGAAALVRGRHPSSVQGEGLLGRDSRGVEGSEEVRQAAFQAAVWTDQAWQVCSGKLPRAAPTKQVWEALRISLGLGWGRGAWGPSRPLQPGLRSMVCPGQRARLGWFLWD